MDMAQASAGLQAGTSKSETLIIFKTPRPCRLSSTRAGKSSGGGVVQAGAGGKSAGPAAGGQSSRTRRVTTLTQNGLQAGVAVEGTKYWKDKDLN